MTVYNRLRAASLKVGRRTAPYRSGMPRLGEGEDGALACDQPRTVAHVPEDLTPLEFFAFVRELKLRAEDCILPSATTWVRLSRFSTFDLRRL
jgi:hypothetical protein